MDQTDIVALIMLAISILVVALVIYYAVVFVPKNREKYYEEARLHEVVGYNHVGTITRVIERTVDVPHVIFVLYDASGYNYFFYTDEKFEDIVALVNKQVAVNVGFRYLDSLQIRLSEDTVDDKGKSVQIQQNVSLRRARKVVLQI